MAIFGYDIQFDKMKEKIKEYIPKEGDGIIYQYVFDNGMKYIGQKTYDKKGNWKTYLGSGIYLKRAGINCIIIGPIQ